MRCRIYIIYICVYLSRCGSDNITYPRIRSCIYVEYCVSGIMEQPREDGCGGKEKKVRSFFPLFQLTFLLFSPPSPHVTSIHTSPSYAAQPVEATGTLQGVANHVKEVRACWVWGEEGKGRSVAGWGRVRVRVRVGRLAGSGSSGGWWLVVGRWWLVVNRVVAVVPSPSDEGSGCDSSSPRLPYPAPPRRFPC